MAKRPRWVKPQRDAMSAMRRPVVCVQEFVAGGIETEVKQIRQGRKSDEFSKLIQEGALRHGAGGCQPCQRHFLADVGAHIGEGMLLPGLATRIGREHRSIVPERNGPSAKFPVLTDLPRTASREAQAHTSVWAIRTSPVYPFLAIGTP